MPDDKLGFDYASHGAALSNGGGVRGGLWESLPGVRSVDLATLGFVVERASAFEAVELFVQ